MVQWFPGFQGQVQILSLAHLPASLAPIFHNLPCHLHSSHTEPIPWLCSVDSSIFCYLESPSPFSQVLLVLENWGPALPFPENPPRPVLIQVPSYELPVINTASVHITQALCCDFCLLVSLSCNLCHSHLFILSAKQGTYYITGLITCLLK